MFQLRWLLDVYSQNFSGEIVDICKIDVEGAEFDVFVQPAHQNRLIVVI
jgi:hypothetical protein